jgi:hypothetical protein
LPVFNSRPIEFCIHRIAGLAERFIYFNDDFILGRPVSPEDFFLPDGRTRIWAVRRSAGYMAKLLENSGKANSHTAAIRNAHRIILERFGQVFPYAVRHFPKAMTVSTAHALWREFPSAVQTTLASPFRSVTDFSVTILYPLYALATGAGMLRRIDGWRQFADCLTGGLVHVGASLGDKNLKRKMACIRAFRPRTFCLNDSPAAADEDRANLRNFLDGMFPEVCRFEAGSKEKKEEALCMKNG